MDIAENVKTARGQKSIEKHIRTKSMLLSVAGLKRCNLKPFTVGYVLPWIMGWPFLSCLDKLDGMPTALAMLH